MKLGQEEIAHRKEFLERNSDGYKECSICFEGLGGSLP